MDRFDAMTAFLTVCETESLTAAARRLGLSPSVMSRQIGALESRLGTRLFHRTTRSLSLTDISSGRGASWPISTRRSAQHKATGRNPRAGSP
jgi:hypothetical protein